MSNEPASITGRDGYIMAQALYWALKYSQQHPNNLRQYSNEYDMHSILTGRFGGALEMFVADDARMLAIIGSEHGKDMTQDKIDALVEFKTPLDVSDFQLDDDVDLDPEEAAGAQD